MCSAAGYLASSLVGPGGVVWLEKGAAVGMARGGGTGVRHDADTGGRGYQREGEHRKERCLHSSVLRGERDVNLTLR